VVKYSRNEPLIKTNPNKPEEKLYKFGGLTAEKEVFFVQIKEDKRKRKYFMSCYGPN